MIYRLEIENFHSIRDEKVIDLTVSKKAPDEPGRLSAIHDGSTLRAPRIVAIFGPNASGKTNVLRAITFLKWFVESSFHSRAALRPPFMKFATNKSIDSPTRLSVAFGFPEDLFNPDSSPTCPYIYTVGILREQHGDRVVEESMYFHPAGASGRSCIFDRDIEGKVRVSNQFVNEAEKSTLEKILRPNASVIPTLCQLNNEFATIFTLSISTVYSNVRFGATIENDSETASLYANNSEMLQKLNKDVRRLDLGISSVSVRQEYNNSIMYFEHLGFDHEISIDYESNGTRKFVQIFPILYHALLTGGVAIIDELDTSFHPIVHPEILRWFEDSNRNPHGAQLWMSCHSVSLLDELNKEEVLICEKARDGATGIYSLKDIKGIGRDKNKMKNYLAGVYGGVPHIG